VPSEEISFRDHIPTADQKTGPAHLDLSPQARGRFYNARTWLSWFLLALLFVGPLHPHQRQPAVDDEHTGTQVLGLWRAVLAPGFLSCSRSC
jgi:hypothetical protein